MRRFYIFSTLLSLSCTAVLAVSPAKWFELKEAGRQQQLSASFVTAEQFYRRSIDEATKIGITSNELAESKLRLANVIVLQRKLGKADPLYADAMALLARKKRDKTLDPELLVLAEELAESYQLVSKRVSGAAVGGLEHALAIRNFISGDRHPEMARTLRDLTQYYVHSGRFAEAEKLCVRLIKIEQEKVGPSKVMIANDFYLLSGIALELKKLDDAESYVRQALAISLKHPDRSALGLHLQRLMLAKILTLKGELILAEKEAKAGLADCERAQGKNSLASALSYVSIGDVKKAGRRYSEAIPYYLKALAVIERNCQPKSPPFLLPLKPLKEAYDKTNPAKARQIQARIQEINALSAVSKEH